MITTAITNEGDGMEPDLQNAQHSQYEMEGRTIRYGHDEDIVVSTVHESQEPEHDEEEIVVHPASHDVINNPAPGQENDIVVAPISGEDEAEIKVAPDLNDKAQEVMKDNLELMKDVVLRIRSDPEFAKSIYRDCPRLQYLLDQHPDLRPIFEDPELIAINFEKVYRDAGGVLPEDEPKEPPKLNFFYRILICVVTSRAFFLLKCGLRIKRIVFYFLSPSGGFQYVKSLVKTIFCGLLHPEQTVDNLVSAVEQKADLAKHALEKAAQRLDNPKVQAKLEALLDEPGKLCEAIESDKVLRALRDMNPLCAALMSSQEMMKVLVNPENLRALAHCPALIAQDFSDPGGWTVPDIEISGGGGGGGQNIGGWTPEQAQASAAAASSARSGGDKAGGPNGEPPAKRGILGDASAGFRAYLFNAMGGNVASDLYGVMTGQSQAKVGEITLDSIAEGIGQRVENFADNINVDSTLAYEQRQAQNQLYFLQYETTAMQQQQQQSGVQSRDGGGGATRDGPTDGVEQANQAQDQNGVESNQPPAEKPNPSRFGWIGEFAGAVVDNTKQTLFGAVFGQAGNFVYAVASSGPSNRAAALDENNPSTSRAVGDGDDPGGDGQPPPTAKKSWLQVGTGYLESAQTVAATAFVGQDFADSLQKKKEERVVQRALKARNAPKGLPKSADDEVTTQPKRRLPFGRRMKTPQQDTAEQQSYR